jgi:hypothetical protein
LTWSPPLAETSNRNSGCCSPSLEARWRQAPAAALAEGRQRWVRNSPRCDTEPLRIGADKGVHETINLASNPFSLQAAGRRGRRARTTSSGAPAIGVRRNPRAPRGGLGRPAGAATHRRRAHDVFPDGNVRTRRVGHRRSEAKRDNSCAPSAESRRSVRHRPQDGSGCPCPGSTGPRNASVRGIMIGARRRRSHRAGRAAIATYRDGGQTELGARLPSAPSCASPNYQVRLLPDECGQQNARIECPASRPAAAPTRATHLHPPTPHPSVEASSRGRMPRLTDSRPGGARRLPPGATGSAERVPSPLPTQIGSARFLWRYAFPRFDTAAPVPGSDRVRLSGLHAGPIRAIVDLAAPTRESPAPSAILRTLQSDSPHNAIDWSCSTPTNRWCSPPVSPCGRAWGYRGVLPQLPSKLVASHRAVSSQRDHAADPALIFNRPIPQRGVVIAKGVRPHDPTYHATSL